MIDLVPLRVERDAMKKAAPPQPLGVGGLETPAMGAINRVVSHFFTRADQKTKGLKS